MQLSASSSLPWERNSQFVLGCSQVFVTAELSGTVNGVLDVEIAGSALEFTTQGG